MLVTRLDVVESLDVTSCLVKGTKEGRKQVFIASGFIATVLFSLLMHLLEKGFLLEADPAFCYVRFTFPSMLFGIWEGSFEVLGNGEPFTRPPPLILRYF